MFDQLKNLKALSGLMGNMPEIKRRMEEMQAELARRTVEGEAGAGAVRVTVNGKLEVLNVQLDPAMIATLAGEGSDADRGMIEELIVSAANDAMRRAQELVKEEMSKAAGGLNLPGMDGLLPPV